MIPSIAWVEVPTLVLDQTVDARLMLGAYTESDLSYVWFYWYSVKKAADAIGVSQSTVRRWIKSGKLRTHTFFITTYLINPMDVYKYRKDLT